MAYDNAPTRYQFGNFDFGGGADAHYSIQGPKGKAGLLYDYGVQAAIEVFNGDTLDPKISVGTPSDLDAYGEDFTLSTALVPVNSGCSIRSTYRQDETGWDTYFVARSIPADQEVVLFLQAATGAGLTGQASPFVEIIWAK